MKKLLGVLVVLLVAACGGNPGGPGGPPLQVIAVDVVLRPSQPTALVTAQLPSVCTERDRIEQRRSGNVVEVTITTRTTSDVCILIYPPPSTFEVPLQGSFTSGEYVVRVNGVEKPFRI